MERGFILLTKTAGSFSFFRCRTGDNAPDVRILHLKQSALNGANEDESAATAAGARCTSCYSDAAI